MATAVLKSAYEIRRANLRLLIEERGATSLARHLGHANPSYLSQLAGPHPSRQISERVARTIEERLHMSPGWLDQPVAQHIILLDLPAAIATRRVVNVAPRQHAGR